MMLIPNRNNGYPFAFFRSDEQKAEHDAQVLRCLMELSNNLNDRDLRNRLLPQFGQAYRRLVGFPAMPRPYKVSSYVIRFMVRVRGGELVWT